MPDLVARGVRFNVIRLGTGPRTLVLVHGLVLDSHASYYLSIAPGLAAHARVLLYDLRGHGRSEQPPAGYTIDDMAADLVALLDAEGLAAPVTLVGNSYGGQIALRVAAAHPGRVRALALIDPQLAAPDFRADLADLLAASPEERDRRAYENIAQWLARHAALRDPAAGSGPAPRTRAETIDDLTHRTRRRPSPGVRTAVGLARDTALVADLARTPPVTDAQIAAVRCPVLAIFGEHSDLRHGEARLARLLPALRVVVVPGMRHTVLMEAPAAVRDALLEWLAQNERAAVQ